MTLQQLRCFVTAAKYQSFHRAAEHLFISQPAVSHQIQLLEKELDTPLFNRSQRKATLTDAGLIFCEDAMDILDRVDFAVQRVKNTASTGRLHIVCESMLVLPELSEILVNFRQAKPNVALNLTTDLRTKGRDIMQKHLADILIAPYQAVADLPELSWICLVRGKYYCVMRPDHPLADRHQLTLQHFAGQTLIFPDTLHCPPEIRKLQHALRDLHAGIDFCYAGSPGQACSMIEAGFGIAMMPEYAVPPSTALLRIPVLIDDEAILVAAWHTVYDRHSIRTFLQIAAEVMEARRK